MTYYLKLTIISCVILITSGCATLPDTQFYTSKYRNQAAQFESARGAVSTKRSAAIVAELKRTAGDLDILDKQIALEQEVVGLPLVVGNKVTLLIDGPATYKAMFEAIKSAKDNINMESFIFEDDEIGQQFADLLIERQSLGVQVNLMYDSAGNITTNTNFFDPLIKAGVHVLEFNPINPLKGKKSWEPNHRDHRKLLIIDGQTAFLGGINISNVYSNGSMSGGSFASGSDNKRKKVTSKKVADKDANKDKSGWRDTDVKLEGPIVAQFQTLFIGSWNKQKGHPLAPKAYYPMVAAQGKDIVRAIGSTPDDPFSLMYLTLISAITNSEKQVYITNAYFVPDPQLIKSLLDAASRGVDVRLILPQHTDSSAAYYAGRSYFSELLKGGIKIYERRDALLHAKTAIVDGIWVSVGSSNLDWRSALDNDEVNAVILGREFSQEMEAAYLNDIKASDEITLTAWQDRSILLKIKEMGARLLGRFL
ncbi:MAG: cardiolipin synthase B [Methylophilaceae bacterium]|nr:cardiolipin synthase B [Methylophilaceae bacterium]